MMTAGLLFVATMLAAPPYLEVSAGGGIDSNAFEFPTDAARSNATSPQPGAFIPLGAEANYWSPSRQLFRFRPSARFSGDFYAVVTQGSGTASTSASDASRWTGSASLPVTLDPTPRKNGGLRADFTLEPFVSAHRETYTSHRTGLPFTTGGVSLADRYNTNKLGLAADVDLALGRDWDALSGLQVTNVDYVEDFDPGDPIVDSWDYREVRARLQWSGTPSKWRLTGGYALSQRDYDERFPRDRATGNLVPEGTAGYEPQVFLLHDVNLGAGWNGEQGRAVLNWDWERRLDLYEGYLNYTENTVGVDFRLDMGRGELRVEPELSLRRYDRAHVNYDAAEPSSSRQRFSLKAGYEWPMLSEWTSAFVEIGLLDQASANPLYTYRRFNGMTGVRVAWR